MRLPTYSRRAIFLGLTGFLFAATCVAEVSLALLFNDGAVLQRNQPVPVWGTAAPHERSPTKRSPQPPMTPANGP
ncbi:MAG: hypothetical protein J6386_12700 [Candidatus Synoicihabitans palmerolidicus]|nr:hypothetical protein [Candidatus Synoicihabitans palmerolidicus]